MAAQQNKKRMVPWLPAKKSRHRTEFNSLFF
nr:MAG TPA: hypothetical protein [Caudoviricetes sp.]